MAKSASKPKKKQAKSKKKAKSPRAKRGGVKNPVIGQTV
jgi:hypothetical protein